MYRRSVPCPQPSVQCSQSRKWIGVLTWSVATAAGLTACARSNVSEGDQSCQTFSWVADCVPRWQRLRLSVDLGRIEWTIDKGQRLSEPVTKGRLK